MADTTWRKSSYSGGGASSCVEIAWRKSSFSGGGNSDCVEVALSCADTLIRDSKNPTGPRLTLPAPALRGLLSAVRPLR